MKAGEKSWENNAILGAILLGLASNLPWPRSSKACHGAKWDRSEKPGGLGRCLRGPGPLFSKTKCDLKATNFDEERVVSR